MQTEVDRLRRALIELDSERELPTIGVPAKDLRFSMTHRFENELMKFSPVEQQVFIEIENERENDREIDSFNSLEYASMAFANNINLQRERELDDAFVAGYVMSIGLDPRETSLKQRIMILEERDKTIEKYNEKKM